VATLKVHEIVGILLRLFLKAHKITKLAFFSPVSCNQRRSG